MGSEMCIRDREKAPAPVLEDASSDDAEAAKAKIEEAGGTVELQ